MVVHICMLYPCSELADLPNILCRSAATMTLYKHYWVLEQMREKRTRKDTTLYILLHRVGKSYVRPESKSWGHFWNLMQRPPSQEHIHPRKWLTAARHKRRHGQILEHELWMAQLVGQRNSTQNWWLREIAVEWHRFMWRQAGIPAHYVPSWMCMCCCLIS